jgi:hypothetical protein
MRSIEEDYNFNVRMNFGILMDKEVPSDEMEYLKPNLTNFEDH